MPPLTKAISEKRRLFEELRLTKGIHAEGLRKQAAERGQLEKELITMKNASFVLQTESSGLKEDNVRLTTALKEARLKLSGGDGETHRLKRRMSVLESEKAALVEAVKAAAKREEDAQIAFRELKQVNESLREQFGSFGKRVEQQEEKRMEKLVLDKMDELKATHVSEQLRLRQQVEELTASLDRVAMDRDQQRRAIATMEEELGRMKKGSSDTKVNTAEEQDRLKGLVRSITLQRDELRRARDEQEVEREKREEELAASLLSLNEEYEAEKRRLKEREDERASEELRLSEEVTQAKKALEVCAKERMKLEKEVEEARLKLTKQEKSHTKERLLFCSELKQVKEVLQKQGEEHTRSEMQVNKQVKQAKEAWRKQEEMHVAEGIRLRNEVEHVKEVLRKREEEHAAEKLMLRQEVEQTKRALGQRHDEATQEELRIRSDLDRVARALKQEGDQHAEEKLNLANELEQAKQALNKQEQVHDAERRKVQDQLDQATSALMLYEERYASMELNLRNEVDNARKQNDEERKRTELMLRHNIEQLNAAVAKKEEEQKRSELHLRNEVEQAHKELQQREERYTAEESRLHHAISQLEDARLTSESHLRTTIERLQLSVQQQQDGHAAEKQQLLNELQLCKASQQQKQEQLSSEIYMLRTELGRVKTDFSAHSSADEAERTAQQKRLAQLLTELEGARSRVSQVQGEYAELQAEKEALERSTQEKMEALNNVHVAEQSRLSAELEARIAETAKVESKLREKDETDERERVALKGEVNALTAELGIVKISRDERDQQLQGKLQELTAEVERKEKLREENGRLRGELNAVRGEIETLRNCLEQVTEKNVRAVEEKAQLEQDVACMKSDLRSAHAKVSNLTEEAKALVREHQEACAVEHEEHLVALTTVEEEVRRLQTEKDALTRRIEELTRKHEEQEMIYASDVTAKRRMNNELSALKASLERAISEREQLRAEAEGVERKLQERSRRVAELEQLNDRLKEQKETSGEQLRGLTEGLATSKAAILEANQALGMSQQELQVVGENLRIKSAEVETMCVENQRLLEAVSNAKQEVLQLQLREKEMGVKIEEINALNVRRGKTMEDLRRMIEERNRECDKLQIDVLSKESKIESSSLELEKSRGVVQALEKRVSELEKARAAVESQHEGLAKQASLCEERLVSALNVEKEKVKCQAKELDEVTDENHVLTATLKHIQEDYVQLKAQGEIKCEALKTQVEAEKLAMKNELVAEQETCNRLQAEVAQLNQQVDKLNTECLGAVEHRRDVESELGRLERELEQNRKKEAELSSSLAVRHDQERRFADAIDALKEQNNRASAQSKLQLFRARRHIRIEKLRLAFYKLHSLTGRDSIRRLGFIILRLFAKMRFKEREMASLTSSFQHSEMRLATSNTRVDQLEMLLEESYEQTRRTKVRFDLELKELRESVASLDQELQCSEEKVMQKEVMLAKAEDVALESQGRLTALENEHRQLQETHKTLEKELLQQTEYSDHAIKDSVKLRRAKALVEEAMQGVDIAAYFDHWMASITAVETRVVSLEAKVNSLKDMAQWNINRKEEAVRTKKKITGALAAMADEYCALLQQVALKCGIVNEKVLRVQTLIAEESRSFAKVNEEVDMLKAERISMGSLLAESKRALANRSMVLLREFDTMAVAVLPRIELQREALLECERKLAALAVIKGDQVSSMSMALSQDLERMERLPPEERSMQVTEELNTLKGKLELVIEEKYRAEALFSLEKRKLEQEVSAWKGEAADLRAKHQLVLSPVVPESTRAEAYASLHSLQDLPLTRQLQNYQSPHTVDQMRRKKGMLLKAANTEPRAAATGTSLREQKEEKAKLFTIKALANAARKEKAAEEELKNSIVVWQDLINAAKLDSPERDRNKSARRMSSPESPLGANHYLLSNDGNLGKKRVALAGDASEEDYRIGSSARALYFFLAFQKILGQRDAKRVKHAFSCMRSAVAE